MKRWQRPPTLIGLQTPGGTGALRIGAELLERAAPGRTIWVGTPTWANHIPIFESAGLIVRKHRFFNLATSDIDFDGMLEDLSGAGAGDILLMHGCCHNPTGPSLTFEQWSALANLMAARGLSPFIDLAYQGLGAGLAADVVHNRLVTNRIFIVFFDSALRPQRIVLGIFDPSTNFGLTSISHIFRRIQ